MRDIGEAVKNDVVEEAKKPRNEGVRLGKVRKRWSKKRAISSMDVDFLFDVISMIAQENVKFLEEAERLQREVEAMRDERGTRNVSDV